MNDSSKTTDVENSSAISCHRDYHHFSLAITTTTKKSTKSIESSMLIKMVKGRRKATPRFAHFVIFLMGLFLSINTHNRNMKIFQEVSERALPLVVYNIILEEAIMLRTKRETEKEVLLTSSIGMTEQRWSDVKLAIYMTTHLSETHISFLPCWYDAIRNMKIFQHADLILYASSYPTARTLLHLPFRNVTIKLYNNTGYQSGAVQAMIDPFVDETDQWFDNYDWVIRLNPDVLIRNDTWLIQTMLNTSIDAIVHDCGNRKLYPTNISGKVIRPKFHTDFTAFRPQAIDRNMFLLQKGRTSKNSEGHMTNALRNIYTSRRFVYVEGAQNARPGRCRIEGKHSPIVHIHRLHTFCPHYYNATT